MQQSLQRRKIYLFGEFRLDPARHRLEKVDGEAVALRAKAFDALVYLVERAGEPVPRKALIEALWPDRVVEENNLTQTVSALRHALGDDYIVTLPGRGYQFVADVRSIQLDVTTAVAPVSEAAHAERPKNYATSPPGPSSPQHIARKRLTAHGGAGLLVGAALALLFAAWGYRSMQTAEVEARAAVGGEVRLVVLPIATSSLDADQQSESDGLIIDLITRIGRVPGLRVQGPATSFALRDSGQSVPQIAEDLGVEYVLETSVVRDRDRVQTSVHLSDAGGFSVGTDSFERPLASLFEISDAIATFVAEQLGAGTQ